MNKIKGKIFTESEIQELIKLYTVDNADIAFLASKFKCGPLKIRDILKNNNITKKVSKLTKNDDTLYKIVCKVTNKEFFGNKNRIHGLFEYLEKELGVITPTYWERKKYLSETGKNWFEQFVDFIPYEKEETKKCKYCEWETVDLENRSGWYGVHLKKEHNIDVFDFIKEYPEEALYFKKHQTKLNREETFNNKDNYITCLECGEKFKTLHNHIIKEHKMTTHEYKLKHSVEFVICKDSYNKFKKNLSDANINMLPTFESAPEREIKDFLQSVSNYQFSKNRKLLAGKEIDLLCEELKLCLEFNGNKWHTEKHGNKGMNYHLDKTRLINEKGFNIIQIFEDEWFMKQDIVKAKLKHIIGVSNVVKIGARKCTVKEINSELCGDFLYKYHIQGAGRNDIYLGAYYNDELVAVMAFNKKRNMTKSKTNYGYELTRFATNYNYVISGMGSKMFNFFIKIYNPESVISFADRRWSFPKYNLYEKIGFKMDGYVKPNYWYYKPKYHRYLRLHKFGFGKNALKKKGLYIEGMTEWECMQHHGWDRIWDCGLIRYIWYK